MTTKLRGLVKERIEESRIAKTDVSRMIGVSRKTLYSWMSDVGHARLGDLARLADAIGCTVGELYEEVWIP